MVINYTQLKLINFPIYALPSDNLEVTDGLLRCDNRLVDDRNQIGKTLGIRRLQTSHKILPLRRCYEDISGLLRAKERVFVDSLGYCFIYERTKFCKVKSHKILKVTTRKLVTTLKVYGVSFPILVKRPPPKGKEFIGMLYFNNKPWLPYEYSETACADFKRKI